MNHQLSAPLFLKHGFALYGIQPLAPSQTFPALVDWLDQGRHGDMEWMAREDTVTKRADPQQILPGAQTVISLAWQYQPDPIPVALLKDPSRGIIARYALYRDYHKVIKKALLALAADLQELYGQFEFKAYVDTGPFLEREWAHRAGLGFIGRNSNLIHYQLGSYLFLAELIITKAIPSQTTNAQGDCGSCRACSVMCPTKAILNNRTIDARRCISYLTIESKTSLPMELRPLLRNRIYGCDICQEICPWNRNTPVQQNPLFQPRLDFIAPPLSTLLFFDDKGFRQRFAGSPIVRATRAGFMRNVAVAIGNWGSPEASQLARQILTHDPSEMVKEHARWAIAQTKNQSG